MGRRGTTGSLLAALAGFGAGAMVLQSCADEPDTSTVDAAAAISALVDWQVDEWVPPPDADENVLPVVYVAAAGGGTIDVAVQAAVAEATADDAVVRFADQTGDSFDANADGAPVHDDGVLVAIGPIPEPARRVTVEIDVYEHQDESEKLTVDITARRPTNTDPSRAKVTATNPR